MIKLKVKDKNDSYNIAFKGRGANVWELVCALDVIIGQLKKHYKLSYQEITEMLAFFKQKTAKNKGGE